MMSSSSLFGDIPDASICEIEASSIAFLQRWLSMTSIGAIRGAYLVLSLAHIEQLCGVSTATTNFAQSHLPALPTARLLRQTILQSSTNTLCSFSVCALADTRRPGRATKASAH